MRLILIEFIPGLPLRDADPRNFSQRERQRIMKAVVDFETLLYSRDIVHKDIHPRNIILADDNRSGCDDQRPLVFIDFGDALFGRTSFYSDDPAVEAKALPGTYISPLLRWHGVRRPAFEFGNWVDWDWQPWLEEEYAHTAASITEEMRERFLPSFLFEPVKSPWED